MKIKHLLSLAAVAMMGLAANAQYSDMTFDGTDYISSDQEVYFVERGAALPTTIKLTLTRMEEHLPYGADFTNIQFSIHYPEGVRPSLDEYGEDYCYRGADVVNARGSAILSFSHNAKPEDGKYPDITYVGANMTKTAITKNPCQFVEFYVKADADMADGDYELKWHTLKYTAYTDEKIQNNVGAANAVKLCTIKVRPTAVEDLNTNKSVSSVKYYNAAGMASDNAFEGVNIVVTKYNDGTQNVTKVVK